MRPLSKLSQDETSRPENPIKRNWSNFSRPSTLAEHLCCASCGNRPVENERSELRLEQGLSRFSPSLSEVNNEDGETSPNNTSGARISLTHPSKNMSIKPPSFIRSSNSSHANLCRGQIENDNVELRLEEKPPRSIFSLNEMGDEDHEMPPNNNSGAAIASRCQINGRTKLEQRKSRSCGIKPIDGSPQHSPVSFHQKEKRS